METNERINEIIRLYVQRAKYDSISQKLNEERKAFMEDWDKRSKENASKHYEINNKLKKLVIEHWIEQGKECKNKSIHANDIPEMIQSVLYDDILRKIRNGCSGDWYDGCRGCEKNCQLKAEEQWKKMFGFETILYGKRENK